jgi:succinoglycan biosynthesis protein ExoA
MQLRSDHNQALERSHPAHVLVVIPTLNEAAHIQALVRQLVAEARSFQGFRLVVVDGGSSDATLNLAEQLALAHPEVEVIRNPARIQSAALNLAARRFGRDADVLVRCDAHAVYPPAYCARLLAALERTRADAVVVPLDSLASSGMQRAVAWTSNSRIGTGGSAHRAGLRSGFVDHGHHAAFRMDMFRKSGGYDESFTHNEDAELDCRQRALGARIYLDGEIRVGYHPRATLAALFKQYYRYGAGRSRTARRHPGSIRLRQTAVAAHVVLTLVALGLSPALPGLLAWPLLYLSVLLVAAAQIAWRKRSWSGLLAAPAAAVMHSAWGLGFLAALRRREPLWQPENISPLWPAALRSSEAA